MKRLLSVGSCFVLLMCFVLPATAETTEKPRKVRYVAPEGFAGHKWGDLRSSFDRLPAEPIGVGAAWMRARERTTEFICVPSATGGCDFQAALLSLRKRFEAGGVYVLSEYAIKDQAFRFGDEADDIVLHPVIYQFCANWAGGRKRPPPDFDAVNKFCGMRYVFQSETRVELRKQPAEFVTTYDRVLEKLIAKFGRPKGLLRRGRVVIETLEGESTDEADRKFSIWRWCPATGDGLHTECNASVTLSLDPVTGVGSVLYSTPLLWEYAYARENYGFKGDRLYKLLHATK